MKNIIRFIGDPGSVLFPQYKQILSNAAYDRAFNKNIITFSLGDNGFAEEYKYLVDNVDPEKNKILKGNHDLYGSAEEIPHNLGDYGTFKHGDTELFFVRGAHSIDKVHRREGIDWFPEEELTTEELYNMLSAYEAFKSDIIVTHDCPQSVRELMFGITDKSRTSQALDGIFEIHKPKLWIFGHHHKNMITVHNGCTFMCLGEMKTFDLIC